MTLEDSLGQTTTIHLSELQSNQALDDGQFSFTPPPGTDVLVDE